MDMLGKTHILIVDDDTEICRLLARHLGDFGLTSHAVNNGAAMTQAMHAHQFDAVILDLMLPGENGFSLCRQLRHTSDIPIIMLTARGESADKVLGLELGADDYILKPFDPRELIARLHTILRRFRTTTTKSRATDFIEFDGWKLHRLSRHLLAPDAMVVPLSNAEFRLLLAFLERPRRVLTREQLMDAARGYGMSAFDRSIDLLVSRLRRKLRDTSKSPMLLKTVRGEGYILDVKDVQ
ncbi:MAG: response regulator transcription factor [Burkholderiales bacterium]|nr:response regulator transcription factor [Burkholderiales bacterium]